jgi:glycosyltransferase involved in cell wall biosynthesis
MRHEARRTLGFAEDDLILLSVGRAEKYRPCGRYDFVATAAKILGRHTHAKLVVVGESMAGIAPHLRRSLPERVYFVGRLEDPSMYRAAADVYLESFPFGSQTALLEAALEGLPVVPAYAPLFPLLVANDDSVQELIPNPQNEDEYVERVSELIWRPELRLQLGERLRTRLLVDHVGDGWLHRLAGMYLHTEHLVHRPSRIPVSQCKTTDADIGLCLWHVMPDGKE